MNHHYSTFFNLLLYVVLFTACSPAAVIPAQAKSAQQAEETIAPPLTPTITPEVYAIDQKVEAYMNGETVSVVELSADERQAFAIKLAEQLNEARGARPLVYNNEAYVDPITGMMKDYDGHPDLEKTIQMYLAASLDSEGNLLIQNEEGTWVKINGSKNIDWNMVVTDPNDPRIDWPILDKDSPQGAVKFGCKLTPTIMLNNEVIQIYTEGSAAGLYPAITLLDVMTDSTGIPILARKMILISSEFNLSKEGSDFFVYQNMLNSWKDGFDKAKLGLFFASLKDCQTYYTVFDPDQSLVFDAAYITQIQNTYENVVSPNQSFETLTNQHISNNLDMLILMVRSMIEAKSNK